MLKSNPKSPVIKMKQNEIKMRNNKKIKPTIFNSDIVVITNQND